MQRGRFFLFLGGADTEGVTSKLKTSEIAYKKKLLNSSIDNWKTILKLLNAPGLAGVVMTLPASTMRVAVSESYLEMTRKILGIVANVPHIIFIHETYFRGNMTGPDDEYYSFGYLAEDERAKMAAQLTEYDLTLAPYKTNAEMSVLASEFVDAHGSNLAFRMYVPHARLWSNETGTMIGLFRDYLTRVSGLNVRQEQHSTPLGTVYEIFADNAAHEVNLESEFRDFSTLLDTALTDPRAAQSLLEGKNVATPEVTAIVDKYVREGRRLQIDLKQDRERKLLSIRHRMEVDLIEVIEQESEWEAVNALVASQIPGIGGVSTVMGLLSAPSSNTSITVNNPQIIQSVNGIVAQEVHGNQHFGPEISEVLRLLQQYGAVDAPALTSAVYEIEDPSIRPEKRLSALQKIKGFAYQAANKIPDVACGVLQSYIESKIGL